MLRLAGFDDPLLARPLALYDTVLSLTGEPNGIDVVYLVAGKMTRRLAHLKPGQQLDVWGPLGNGFEPKACDHLILVAGGIGYTPFPAMARECLGRRTYGDPARRALVTSKVTLCYGARTAGLLAGIDDFDGLGVDVRVATEDGSRGHHGLVTEVLNKALDPPSQRNCRIVCCGPEPMMEAVALLAHQSGVPCEVSLETPMACGVGICFTCVAKVRDGTGGWDYKRTCVDGPVFDAKSIEW